MRISKQYINHYEDGEALIIDERDFNDCKQHQLEQIRKKAMELILTVAPEYKQRNAALGLLPQTEADEIKNTIQTIRTQSNLLEAQIQAVQWDGTEEARSMACDAVQTIRWD